MTIGHTACTWCTVDSPRVRRQPPMKKQQQQQQNRFQNPPHRPKNPTRDNENRVHNTTCSTRRRVRRTPGNFNDLFKIVGRYEKNSHAIARRTSGKENSVAN